MNQYTLIAKSQVVVTDRALIKCEWSACFIFLFHERGRTIFLQSEAFKSSSQRFVKELGYQIVKQIGNGSFGFVFETSNGKILKVVDAKVTSNMNEMKMLQLFRHENVVRVSSRLSFRSTSQARVCSNKRNQ